ARACGRRRGPEIVLRGEPELQHLAAADSEHPSLVRLPRTEPAEDHRYDPRCAAIRGCRRANRGGRSRQRRSRRCGAHPGEGRLSGCVMRYSAPFNEEHSVTKTVRNRRPGKRGGPPVGRMLSRMQAMKTSFGPLGTQAVEFM